MPEVIIKLIIIYVIGCTSKSPSRPTTETRSKMMEPDDKKLNQTDSTGFEFLTENFFQLTNLTLSALACILMVIGIALIIHLIRTEKKRIRETRAAITALREVTQTSRIDPSVEANLPPVRFNRGREWENSYVEIDDAFCEAFIAPAYDEADICKELDAYYDCMFGRDSITFQKNLNSTLPDLTLGKDEEVSSFIKNCAAN